MLLAGLARMEYRGYDSAGIATLGAGKLTITKAKGKVAALTQKVHASTDVIGIGHTRWATHGEPSERNAHPHVAGNIAIVHNGIIENYKELKDELARKGAVFVSETDSEVLAHLIKSHYKGDLAKSVQQALRQVTGTFGLAVISADEPGKLVAARRGSPLLIGLSQTATFVASDPAALIGYVKDVIYVNDDELAVCKPGAADVFDFDLHPKAQARETLQMELEAIQKQGYDHFLLKEIMDQPASVEAVLRGRLLPDQGTSHLGGLNLSGDHIRAIERIVIIGCGTAYYAGLLGKYLIESLTHIPVDVEVASEFRYRDPVLSKNSVALIISQSGETADTLACVEELKRRGVHTLGLVNVVGSTIARTVDGGIYLHAGPEISVASTKAFTNQVVAQMLFALHVARQRDLSLADGKKVVTALERLPHDIAAALKTNTDVAVAAKKVSHFKNAIYLGRNTLFPIALEGALKLKEVSYVHAEAYAAGEVKHGPIALIDPDMLVVFLLGKGLLADKAHSNLQEIKARGGTVLMVTDTGAEDALHVATHSPWTSPLVMNVVLQLLAYHIAVACGRDVDQPRNLAKSVTVE